MAVLESDSICDVMLGWHDGYLRLRDPAVHLRCFVVMKPRYCLVLDRIEGRGRHQVVQYFHVAPGLSVTIDGCPKGARIVGTRTQARVIVFTISSGGEATEAALGVADEPAEFEFGRPVPHPVIYQTCVWKLPLVLGALLLGEVAPGDHWLVQAAAPNHSHESTVLQIQGPGLLDEISVNWGSRPHRGAKGSGRRAQVSFRRVGPSVAGAGPKT
jgi:hypothetical protein